MPLYLCDLRHYLIIILIPLHAYRPTYVRTNLPTGLFCAPAFAQCSSSLAMTPARILAMVPKKRDKFASDRFIARIPEFRWN